MRTCWAVLPIAVCAALAACADGAESPNASSTITAAPIPTTTTLTETTTMTAPPNTVTQTTTITAPSTTVTRRVTVTKTESSSESGLYGGGSSGESGSYYANCSEARAAGAAPIYRGEPGYRAGLDRDGDGVACE
jgi:hypothetical protein